MSVQRASLTRPDESPHSTAAVSEFRCLFTHDLRRKQKRWQDGRLKYHSFNKRIMVYDDRGNFLGDLHWREDYPFDEGEEIELERGSTIVQVSDCVGRTQQDLSELVDKRVKEREDRHEKLLARQAQTPQPEPNPKARPQLPTPGTNFQFKHVPLSRLVGAPTGHHGRAFLPTESPYEERQRLARVIQDENNRPTKRRRHQAESPPSKSGYAKSLFGATLTLSSQPAARLEHAVKTSQEQGAACSDGLGDNPRSSGISASLASVLDHVQSVPKEIMQTPTSLDSRPIPEKRHEAISASDVRNRSSPINEPATTRQGFVLVERDPRRENSRPSRDSCPELLQAKSTKDKGGCDDVSLIEVRKSGRQAPRYLVTDENRRETLTGTPPKRGAKGRKRPSLIDPELTELSAVSVTAKATQPPRRIGALAKPDTSDQDLTSPTALLVLSRHHTREDAQEEQPMTELRIMPRKKRGLLIKNSLVPPSNIDKPATSDGAAARIRPEKAPGPRLAKLKKNIRSREIIGGVVVEPPSDRNNVLGTGHFHRGINSEMRVVGVSEPPTPQLCGDSEAEANGNLAAASDELAVPQVRQVSRTANPATRGRKAARASDAAGQLPQSVPGAGSNQTDHRLQPEELNSSLGPGESVSSDADVSNGNSNNKANAKPKHDLPGFISANGGGPWSREAYDLFENGRPG